MKFKVPQKKEDVEALFRRFTGELVQTPPKMSAVRKAPRKRTVHYLRLLELDGRLALFETKVDAGTYIRTLCDDLGKECGGARMEELRRTSVGRISERDASTMYGLIDAMWLYGKGDASMLAKMLRAPESLIELPKVHIKAGAVASIRNGAQVMIPAIEKIGSVRKGDLVAICSGEEFVGVGVMQVAGEELQRKRKGLAVRMERVHAR